MGKLALLAVILLTLMGSYYSLSSNQGLQSTTGRLATHQFDVLARNAAKTGFQHARQALADDFSSTTLNGTYAGSSTYSVTVAVNGTVARITSVGHVTDANGKDVSYRIQSNIDQAYPSYAPAPPVFMQYALLTGGDLTLTGNVSSQVLITGEESNSLNANMHTNGQLFIDGNAVLVEGFGTYITGAASNPASALANTFQPHNNTTSAPTVQQLSDPVEIPTFDIDQYLSNMDNAQAIQTTTGDVTLSGSYDFGGTRAHPHVWHIQGNVTSSGNVTISDYTILLIEGNVELSGDLTAGSTTSTGSESGIALYASGTVDLSGSITIHGQIFADGDIRFAGTPEIYGSVTARGSADVSLAGTPKIYYRPASSALTTNWQGVTTNPAMLAYSEWPGTAP